MSSPVLPVIKLSDAFLKVLNLDAKTANTLAPVFAARVERLTSTGAWAPRAVLINKDGIVRVFECGSGRITHAMDIGEVNEFNPIELDAAAAKVRSYQHISLTVGLEDKSATKDQQLTTQCVRMVGTCKAKLSLDDRLARHEMGLGDAVTFEDDLLLRFVTTPQCPLALQFVAAIKYFGADRGSNFEIQRSAVPLEEICSAKYKSAYNAAHKEGASAAGDTDTIGRRKPSRLADSFNILKKEITTIQSLASRTKADIIAAGGVLEEPPATSPRALGASESDAEHDEADVAKSDGSEEAEETGGPLLHDDDALMKLLTRPKLTTIPLHVQRSDWAPKYISEVMHRLAPQYLAQHSMNVEVYSRWKLLAHYAEVLQLHRTDRIRWFESQADWLRAVLDDVVTPYTVAKLQAMHVAFQSLHIPLPEFDRKAFDDEMLEALYERDSLEEANDALTIDVEHSRKELQLELVEDAEEVRQEEESAEVLERLQTLQASLKQRQQDAFERTHHEKIIRHEACVQTLGKQEIEIERLRAHLHRLKSVYALHDELMHDVAPQPTGPTCASMGEGGRRIRMMNDV